MESYEAVGWPLVASLDAIRGIPAGSISFPPRRPVTPRAA
jgi:hypothetical protein